MRLHPERMVEQAAAAACLERTKRQSVFLLALQRAIAEAEPARLLMLLRAGGLLFDGDEKALLNTYRQMLQPVATEAIENAATILAPLGREE